MFEKNEYKVHPLLLEESRSHYDTGGTSNIIKFECVSTIANALGACTYNIIKYKNRDKGTNELDDKKRQTFEQWQELLRDLLAMGYNFNTNLRFAMKSEYPEIKYTLGENNDK